MQTLTKLTPFLVEFLPRVLGGHVLDGFGLRLLPSGYYQGYDSDCSASIFNEFATAAFRYDLNWKY